MIRETLIPRPDWPARAIEVGFTYHQANPDRDPGLGAAHWDESTCYRFTLAQVEEIEAASAELHRLCLLAVDHVVNRDPGLMDLFMIPDAYRGYVARSWNRRDPDWMGRFDLGYDPAAKAVKLLEYNADTPTMVVESAVFQWYWMEAVKPGADQFNSLHDKLILRLRDVAAASAAKSGEPLYFATLPATREECRDDSQAWSDEEYQHGLYFRDLALQAGVEARWISLHDIGHDAAKGFVDLGERPIRFLHKLYPWEWMAADAFGAYAPDDRTRFVEPPWKMLLSNKALLAVLWKLFPGHPNLLPAHLAGYGGPEAASELGPRYFAKPILSREGSNIRLVEHGAVVEETAGTYSASPVVFQRAMPLPDFDGNTVTVCSWMAGGEPAGMILREGGSRIVTGDSRIVPHYFVG